ncbi:hypothetical protein PIB30_055121 [Stylosanthes scabra]|uniref:Uncharacterized protein n=1 Tax=Stylosanthes scabra TaxID=79078 RepID=A0ABU6WKZ3_9FABA|nr:hypothetical protein [Stylosanthes scabra]
MECGKSPKAFLWAKSKSENKKPLGTASLFLLATAICLICSTVPDKGTQRIFNALHLLLFLTTPKTTEASMGPCKFQHHSNGFCFFYCQDKKFQKLATEKGKRFRESVRQPCDHPNRRSCGEDDPPVPKKRPSEEGMIWAINHAQITRS